MDKKRKESMADFRNDFFITVDLGDGVRVEHEKYKKMGGKRRKLEVYTKDIPETPNQPGFRVIKVLKNIGFRTADDHTPIVAGARVEMVYNDALLEKAKNLYGDHIREEDLKVGWFDVKTKRWRGIKDAIKIDPEKTKGYGAIWKNWPLDPPVGWGC